jgi:hypothetical protein
LEELKPSTRLPTICLVNGEPILAADWHQVELEPADVAVFMCLPKGGGGGGGSAQAVIGVLLIIAGTLTSWAGGTALIYMGVAILASGLMPMPNMRALAAPASGSTEAASPTYNIQLSGNTARLGQAMPVPYGRHLIMPDFAGNPYTEYDGDTDDQIYYALMCVGVMDNFTIESVTIDDTVISHFADVAMQWIGPQFGNTLTLVNPAVVTAPEVAGQDMILGTVVGPFAACGPGMKATRVGIDIVLPKGLYFASDTGTLTAKSVTYMFEARSISDSGAASGNWFLLAVETLELAQNSPVRRSYSYNVSPARYEVRAQRIDVRDDNARAAHDVQWAGLRTYLAVSVPLEPNANFLALKIRASSQLSGLSQRKVAVIVRRWLPSWTSGGGWADPTETRSIAWALADVLRNPVYGPAVPDSRIDLQTLAELNTLWQSRQDYFNGVFDKRITVWQALTTIARCGRARPVMRGNVFTFVRDGPQTLPVALFNSRNIRRKSLSIGFAMPTEDTPDGLELEFFDEITWSSNYVTMPIPGVVGDPLSPARISIMGISHLKQAQRECAYITADMAYRPIRAAFETELEGHLPALGDLVAVSPQIVNWGYNGEIVDWDPTTAEAICSEKLSWSVGDLAILTDAAGDVHGPYSVIAGTAVNSMKFLESTIVPYVGTERERTRYTMGPAATYTKLCKVVTLTPSGDDTVQVRVVVEDNRVHTADEAYAGYGGATGGSTGGITGRPLRYGPDDLPSYDDATEAQRERYGFYANDDLQVGSEGDPPYVFTI